MTARFRPSSMCAWGPCDHLTENLPEHRLVLKVVA